MGIIHIQHPDGSDEWRDDSLTQEQHQRIDESNRRLNEMKANGGFEPLSESLQDRMNQEEKTNFFLRRHSEVVKMHEEVGAKFLAEILAKSRAVGVGPTPKRTKPTE